MAIRAMWNFNHLPVGITTGVSGFNLNSYGITWYFVGYSPQTPTVQSDGSLELLYGQDSYPSANISMISIPASSVTDGISPKSYMGLKITESAGAYSWWLKPSGLTINDLLVISRQDPLMPPVYTSFYLEVGIDRVKKEVTIYVDNVLIKTMTDANAVAICAAYNGANPWRFGWTTGGTNGGAYRGNVSNLYFADEVVGETESARQGPVTISPIVITSAVGPDWTSSDSKPLLDDLLTPYSTAASLTSPVIRSGDPYSDLRLGMDAAISAGQAIKATQFLFDGVRHAKTTTQPVLSVSDDTNSTALTPFVFGAAFAYGLKTGINAVAPDGGAWTIEKLKAAKLVVSCTDS